MNINKISRAVAMVMPVFLMLMHTGYLQAQSYTTSTTHTYIFDDVSDSTIVRNWEDTAVFTCSHCPSNNQYSHIFHMRQSMSALAKMVGLPIMMSAYGRIVDRINDMRILENECYFCGTRITPISAEIMYDPFGNMYFEYTYDTCGFIGYYSFDNSFNILGNIEMHLIHEIKTALRMAVYNSNYDNNVTCIELVGVRPTGTTCLVEMSRTSTSPDAWSYYVITPDLTDEILTDVIVTDELVITASVYASNDGEIGFRHTKPMQYPFVSAPPNNTNRDLFKYDTRSYTSSHYLRGFVRLPDAPVKLCVSPYGFFAGVAGKPVSISGSLLIGHYVFVFDMAWPSSMREFQSAHSQMHLTLKEITFLKQREAVGILYSSKYNPSLNDIRTFLQFPRMGAVSVGGQYTDTLLYRGTGDLHSIDTYREHSVSLSGIKHSGGLPFDGIQRQYNRSNSCLDYHGEDVIYRDPVLTPYYINSGWNILDMFDTERKKCTPIILDNSSTACAH